jgi:N-acetyl-gamma-glutamyl-phosphate reductase
MSGALAWRAVIVSAIACTPKQSPTTVPGGAAAHAPAASPARAMVARARHAGESALAKEGVAMPRAARVFIDGEAGTTGLGIRERLRALPVELVSVPTEHRKDAQARREAMAAADLAVLCLPDDAARESVALADALGHATPRLLDASTAHRVARGWTYGFAELEAAQPARIAASRRVANPGCYATGAIALIRPLVDAGLLPPDYPLTINAVSGYSGGGRAMIAAHEREHGPAFELYALGLEHKHVPEIEMHARLARRPLFVPSVGHFAQGMLVSVPLCLDRLTGCPSGADLHAALAAHYAATRVRVLPPAADGRLEAEALNGTDVMELRVHANDARGHAVLVARLDNLGKGASGVAVQNIALMLGLEQPAGVEPAHA